MTSSEEQRGSTGATCGSTCGCAAAPTGTARGEHAAPARHATRCSHFEIPGMDCPSEERLIRMQLADCASHFDFDLPARRLALWHSGPAEAVLDRLAPLGFGARLLASEAVGAAPTAGAAAQHAEGRTLVWLLAINALMFLVEGLAGWWAESSGLLADGLDMFADAAVYGAALWAVGRGVGAQFGAARLAGWLQALLAAGLFVQVAWRAVHGAEPLGAAMMAVSVVALAANLACLLLIGRHRHGGAHMRASYIFSANDVLANLGVIIAGALVLWTGSQWPDIVIGTVIGVVVLLGALKILRLQPG
ncbi:MAG: cation transporter [Zoogloeaceae bacterium]|nr:cation transporter [Rhodocyclaceae bacterium]MCP5232618.1 cation transporter [Zoogloeaceae bacterium]MCP5240701.1 cation transporter [Zoogloeaceae bacterium]MCP5253187.1 cation transporter [Zoogloeaceae bacterium]MCP5293444.1 cation transporter [Zoogloeaceae bacterium]